MSEADDQKGSSVRRQSIQEGNMNADLLKSISDEVPKVNLAKMAARSSQIETVLNYCEGGSVSTKNDDQTVPNKDIELKDCCDYRAPKILKASEIWKLREDLLKARNVADEEKSLRKKFEGRLRELEQKLNLICFAERASSKHVRLLKEEIASLKTKQRAMRDETEELQLVARDNMTKMDEYRTKFMQAEQAAEEYKRHIEHIDFDNKVLADQIQTEIQRVKLQFQVKLQELSPLPELLKGSQVQLQEAKQLQQLAAENCQHLSLELGRVKEKVRKLYTIYEE